MFWISIDKNIGISIIRQIYEQIRNKILSGDLKAGDLLPSTRALSASLQVSRNVVLEAYQTLIAEGYLISKPNTGTFVAEGAVLDKKAPLTYASPEGSHPDQNGPPQDIIDFRSGFPALDRFPRKKWAQIQTRVLLDSADALFGYGEPEGRPELRNSICQYLQRTRGVRCHPDQIVITTSSVQSCSILSHLLLKDGRPYILEDPEHIEIQKIFGRLGTPCHSIPVDESGLQTGLLPQSLSPAFVFVTPSHQYPLGANLPIQRRIELIQYARAKQCYIIEDDYDSEFRYEGLPVSSMQGLEPNLVIYIGTFSKVLFPSTRIGYVILPWPLVAPFREMKKSSDLFTNTLEQLTMARFIDEHLLDRHVANMKKIYHRRRDYLIERLHQEFPHEVSIMGESTGLHLVAIFKSIDFKETLVDALAACGVRIHPVYIHSAFPDYPRNRLIMGYSHLSSEKVDQGLIRLKDGLRQFC